MTYNVFGGTLNLAQSIEVCVRISLPTNQLFLEKLEPLTDFSDASQKKSLNHTFFSVKQN